MIRMKNTVLLLFTLCLCFFAGSCKCSNEKDTDNRNMETSTIDTLQSTEAETSSGNTGGNRSDNAVLNENDSDKSKDVAMPVDQDTTRTVPSGGSTSKKARFSSSGNN